MDTFSAVIGIVGLVLLILSFVIIIYAIIHTIKGKKKIKQLLTSIIMFLILLGFSTSFIFLSLFLQTFSRYTHEEKIGWIYAERTTDKIVMTFYDEKRDNTHYFNLNGDQWMVEGYFLRWSLALRWLGAGSYYRVTRFTGRWQSPDAQSASVYQVHREEPLWKLLLKHGKRIPFVDAAYGIGAFQYPSSDTFELYINDTGFIIRRR